LVIFELEFVSIWRVMGHLPVYVVFGRYGGSRCNWDLLAMPIYTTSRFGHIHRPVLLFSVAHN
jgi:hypothetical protein